MKVFEANITQQVSERLIKIINNIESYERANQKMLNQFGIIDFFESDEELGILKRNISNDNAFVEENEREEYGDFQTNLELANNAIYHLTLKNISPEVIIEPTCGKGNFIIASLRNFNNIKYILGVEIYKPYIWQTKFNIIEYLIFNPKLKIPIISIVCDNVFEYDFKYISKRFTTSEILIIGNPPWVTNSKLGFLDSLNLPNKSNFKNHKGIHAITGKSNFDIAEFITLKLLKDFQNSNGHLMLLLKNSVIKNIVFDQKKNHFKISSLEKHCIDSKKEFNVSVDSAFFYCKLNSFYSDKCIEFDFYNLNKYKSKFGWQNDKFVSNVELYNCTNKFDGNCPYIWRQGIKHDCSIVMELEKENGNYKNRLNEKVFIENDLVYGFIKSSDLKNKKIDFTRKFTIVTQRKVGQETNFIKYKYPKTYQYLLENKANFDARKSSIYKNKPLFSIFGIGDYSYKPYKVAISGFYKIFQFTLILPQDNKPVMLDDTCYFLGFDQLEFAVYTLILLNSDLCIQFLKSITFLDSKRPFTKENLMRIDLLELAKKSDKIDLKKALNIINDQYDLNLKLELWEDYINNLIIEKIKITLMNDETIEYSEQQYKIEL